MLPFLAKKNQGAATQAGLLVKTRTPDEKPDQDDPSAAIDACSKALIDAVHARDAKGVSAAIKDAFDILESMPHEEESAPEPHSYESQAGDD